MKIAILGSNSQIARSIKRFFSGHEIMPFCRTMDNYDSFGREDYDLVVNCVGVSQPVQQKKENKEIVKISNHFDNLALKYAESNKNCLYVFFSSGVIHEAGNSEYKKSKQLAEKRHRNSEANVIDLRVYSFFSRFSNINSGFYMDEIVKCMQTKNCLGLFPVPLYRDYVAPVDIANFILSLNKNNRTYEIFSAHTVSTFDIARHFKQYGLRYKEKDIDIPITGIKEHYYAKRHDGFKPTKTSMETIIEEVKYILS